VRHVAVRSVAALLGLVTVAACAGSGAEGDGPPQVVVLRSVADPYHDAFLEELRDQRFVLGRDVTVAPEGGAVVHETPDEAAAELAAASTDAAVVVAYSTPNARAALDAGGDVPIVSVVNDPVASELLADRDRPEGHLTGVTFTTPMDRTLQLASAVVGEIDRVGFLVPADDPAIAGPRERLEREAARIGAEVVEADFTGTDDVPAAVAELAAADVDVVLLGASNAVLAALERLERELAAAALPVVANNSRATFAVAVLEPDGHEVRRQVARQVARLLRGDPVEMVPVEDPRRFRTLLDRERVAQLGLPPLDEALLRQADEVR
jgi:putative tryptophan/tyrosine transport system substrate-binding protein